jgi:hypothetical protein
MLQCSASWDYDFMLCWLPLFISLETYNRDYTVFMVFGVYCVLN